MLKYTDCNENKSIDKKIAYGKQEREEKKREKRVISFLRKVKRLYDTTTKF